MAETKTSLRALSKMEGRKVLSLIPKSNHRNTIQSLEFAKENESFKIIKLATFSREPRWCPRQKYPNINFSWLFSAILINNSWISICSDSYPTPLGVSANLPQRIFRLWSSDSESESQREMIFKKMEFLSGIKIVIWDPIEDCLWQWLESGYQNLWIWSRVGRLSRVWSYQDLDNELSNQPEDALVFIR